MHFITRDRPCNETISGRAVSSFVSRELFAPSTLKVIPVSRLGRPGEIAATVLWLCILETLSPARGVPVPASRDERTAPTLTLFRVQISAVCRSTARLYSRPR